MTQAKEKPKYKSYRMDIDSIEYRELIEEKEEQKAKASSYASKYFQATEEIERLKNQLAMMESEVQARAQYIQSKDLTTEFIIWRTQLVTATPQAEEVVESQEVEPCTEGEEE